MPGESFRFIHASDFHLEEPLGDLDGVPPHLREAMVGAPQAAARAVLEAAGADNIDFLVLSGDLLSPMAAGPHGMSLLLEGFARLHAAGKPVFWAAGLADDPQRWPEAVPLPPNVHLFPKGRVESVPVVRAGRTICLVVGRSSEGRGALHVAGYDAEATDEFTVAVGFGTTEAAALAETRFDYWALGGEHNRRELPGVAEAGAIYAGSPQGRSLREFGPHGYTVVDVDAERNARLHAVECDTFRYCDVEIDADEIRQVGNLRSLLGERIGQLQNRHGGRHLLIGWDIVVAGDESIQRVGDADELMTALRRDFGHGTPAAWTVRLSIRPPRRYPKSWSEEDTILGDYLRAAEKHRKSEARELNLLPCTEEFMADDGASAALPASAASLLAEVPAAARADLLDRATLLGVEMLRGGKPKLVRNA